jgi:hypothetical protein
MPGMDPAAQEDAPAWQHWLLPETPRLSHFLVGAAALLLPVAAGIVGPDGVLPAMGAASVIGGGLGLGWLLACGPRWLRRAPVPAAMVLAMSLGCLGHLAVMPRWEVLLRANAAIAEARTWIAGPPEERTTLPPLYDTGDGPVRFTEVASPRPGGDAIVLYTPQALTRWSAFGRVESCYIVVRRDGTAQVLRTGAERDALLAGQPLTP